MNNWKNELYERLGDIIELEIAIHLMIRKNERNSIDKYKNIKEFYHNLIQKDIVIYDYETFHRFYKTSNIHNYLRVKLKPKKAWEEEKVIHPESFKSILAIRLGETKLMAGTKYIDSNIKSLSQTYKQLNSNIEQILDKISKNTFDIKLEPKLIAYKNLYELYSYFMDEIENYSNEFEQLRALLYLELDYSFVLYNELLRMIHLIKKYKLAANSKIIEKAIGEISMKLANIEFPWLRLVVLRAFIDNIKKYHDINSLINDISHIINYTLLEIEQWIERAEIEEGIRDLMNVKYGRIPYLDAIIENRYKRNSIKEYFTLLKHEFGIRWLRGRDFNDQDRNTLHRAIKDISLNLIGYNN